VPGHYCLQVAFTWGDDVNPYNNLGQENLQIGLSHSPVSFQFALANLKRSPQTFRFEMDSYTIPPLPGCREGKRDSSYQVKSLPSLSRPMKVPPAHDRRNYPVPAGWDIGFVPSNPEIAPGGQQTVVATVNPPAGFKGRQSLNVHVFSGQQLVGGMTFYVEGT
jgi:hypothetical protein